jgi:hypothetical protein
LHLKTAGTTWLEELTGLAESGGSGLAVAREIYAKVYSQRAELCAPYATVIDIDVTMLPKPDAVNGWSSERFTSTLRHDQGNREYNPGFRKLLHVGFKVAAKMGDRYLKELQSHHTVISRNVTTNLFERHIRPVFLGLGLLLRLQADGKLNKNDRFGQPIFSVQRAAAHWLQERT